MPAQLYADRDPAALLRISPHCLTIDPIGSSPRYRLGDVEARLASHANRAK
jgi:hypothetical protein